MRNTSKMKRGPWLLASLGFGMLIASFPPSAWAMTGPFVDKMADILTWVVMLFVPVLGIYLFWIVHILPEKIAEKRHHPQKEAIKTLCILSLVFGGMLWPLAWLWAYSKPVLHKLAFGTDKHEDYYLEEGAEAEPATDELSEATTRLRRAIGRMSAKGVSAQELDPLKRELAEIEGTLSRMKNRQGKEGET
jgi:Protein of unknown function (DUF3302)